LKIIPYQTVTFFVIIVKGKTLPFVNGLLIFLLTKLQIQYGNTKMAIPPTIKILEVYFPTFIWKISMQIFIFVNLKEIVTDFML